MNEFLYIFYFNYMFSIFKYKAYNDNERSFKFPTCYIYKDVYEELECIILILKLF